MNKQPYSLIVWDESDGWTFWDDLKVGLMTLAVVSIFFLIIEGMCWVISH